jgi:hypothetical protein
MSFQVGPFQTNFQQVPPETTPAIIPGGVRKRRILPDGRQIFATEQEAVDTLLLYYHEHKLKAKESAVLGLEPKRKKVIVLPSERRDIIDALETLRLADYKRRREEEWIILFH